MNKIKGKKERKRKKGKEKEKRKGKKGKALSRKITRTNPCSGRVKTVSLSVQGDIYKENLAKNLFPFCIFSSLFWVGAFFFPMFPHLGVALLYLYSERGKTKKEI